MINGQNNMSDEKTRSLDTP